MNTTNFPFTIAEVGQAHEGSLGMAHAYIDALAAAGIAAVKFQCHIAEAESSIYEPFRVKFSVEDKSRYDYWKRMEFTTEEWAGLKQHCDEKSVVFMASPFSNAAVDLLEKLQVKHYKIGSGEVTNLLLLEKISRSQKPVILSSGMSNWEELDAATQLLRAHNVQFSVMQCTTQYPTQPENYGLNLIPELKARYKVPVGFSDHSAKMETCIAAVALGAELVEFHAVFSREQFGPDSTSSLTIDEIKCLVKSLTRLKTALKNPIDKSNNRSYADLKKTFEKSLAVNKNLPQGHRLSFEDLEAKKPAAQGIAAKEYEVVIGKTLNKPKNAWDFLTYNDLD
ncbi:MAG: N-acetylneuraminate synthase family protein [Flavobacteriaceae bacterium]|nr:N-acetylneuraminate synthase family protein [Flavobacteriaceae bacterium]